MTTAHYEDNMGFEAIIEEVYRVPTYPEVQTNNLGKFQPYKKESLNTFIEAKESEIKKSIEASGGKVLSLNSEFISKRRYKRRLAKELKKQAKL